MGRQTWEFEIRRKASQESATFLQRIFDQKLHCSFSLSAAQLLPKPFGQNDIRTAEKPMLQCNFCVPKIASQLPSLLVAGCRGGA